MAILYLRQLGDDNYIKAWRNFVYDSVDPAVSRIEEWGGHLYNYHYIQFRSEEEMTLFLLRWS